MNLNFSNHFEALSVKFGDREALVNVERGRRYTYRQLHLLTNQIVNAMRSALSLGAGDVYLCVLQNDNLSLLHLPTIFKGAATAAYSNYRDSLEELAWQVQAVKPKVAFIENALLKTHAGMFREAGVTIVCMDPLSEPADGVLYFGDLLQGASDKNPDVVLDDRDHIALIRCTGGTTGKGKPVPYSIDNWLAQRDSCFAVVDMDWSDGARALHMAPMSHGSAIMVLPVLFCGGCTVTLNEIDLDRYCQIIERERITTSMAVPTMLYRLLDLPSAQQYDLSSMSTFFYGGAPMNAAKLKQLQSRFGNVFTQGYAASESVALSIALTKADHRVDKPEDEARLASTGRITGSSEVRLMDDEGKPVAQGETGEIWLRSRTTVKGYYNDPDQTAQEFVDGFWKSGDIARMDEAGYIYIVDRKKDMIISGGFNVYAAEVEAALGLHEAVLMSAIVGIPHEEWGEAVHAEVVLRHGASVEDIELMQHVKEKLGAYKAPKSVAFVRELPLTPVGKVLRRAVREKYWKRGDRQIG
jgi:fatty-acyl-CoA synthase